MQTQIDATGQLAATLEETERLLDTTSRDKEALTSPRQLASGRSIEVENRGNHERVTFRAPSGEIELAVELTANGPVLRMAAAALEVNVESQLKFECDSFELNAKKDVAISSEGQIRQSANDGIELKSDKDLVTEARETTIRSSRGDVRLEANDHVRLAGELIRLNC